MPFEKKTRRRHHANDGKSMISTSTHTVYTHRYAPTFIHARESKPAAARERETERKRKATTQNSTHLLETVLWKGKEKSIFPIKSHSISWWWFFCCFFLWKICTQKKCLECVYEKNIKLIWKATLGKILFYA